MKHHDQVDVLIKEVRNAALVKRRVFNSLPLKVFLRANTALVRPVPDYCIQVLSQTMLGDMAKNENVQPMITKLVPVVRVFPYEVRFAFLRLFSMQTRRLNGDLLWVFKKLKGKFVLTLPKFYP